MDCLTARSTLDLAPLNSAEGPETVQAANEHLAACPDCQSVVAARQAFDRRVGGIVRDVPVPSGLKERLLAQLAAQPAAAPAPIPGRRRMLRWTIAAAALFAVAATGLTIVLTLPPQPTVTYNELTEQVTTAGISSESLPPLTAFASGTRASPPVISPLSAYVKGPSRRMTIGRQEVGIWTFSVPARSSRRAIPARLLVAPRSRVKLTASAPGTHGSWSLAHWDEGDRLYVLALEGPESELRRLVGANQAF